jgi:hypothetical protein
MQGDGRACAAISLGMFPVGVMFVRPDLWWNSYADLICQVAGQCAKAAGEVVHHWGAGYIVVETIISCHCTGHVPGGSYVC